MGQETKISWTHHTANFWWGCQRVSPGCEHCYAEHLAVVRRKLPVWGPPSTTKRERKKGVWTEVPKWNQAAREAGVRRRMFVSSMADIFEDHPDVTQWRADALALLETCTNLDVQLLTKRPQNIMQMVPASWHTAWPKHIWAGTTVEDKRRAHERIPHLLRVPAAVRFLSCEPLLESVDLTMLRVGEQFDAEGADFYNALAGRSYWDNGDTGIHGPRIHQVIVGGESGSDARPFHVEWARDLLRQCRAAGVAAFCKQFGDNVRTRLDAEDGWWSPDMEWPHHNCGTGRVQFHGDGFGNYQITGLSRAGADPEEWPREFRVQQFPSAAGT